MLRVMTRTLRRTRARLADAWMRTSARRLPACVSICIPAWMAAPFIDNTLRFASGQTWARLRILVSVDAGSDATAEICRLHAAVDSRIAVFEQRERLGWAANANFLLDRVDTPYFFLYFHDDILLPQYTATLLRCLEQRSDALSAHCDMGHHGARADVSYGCAYEGSTAQRLLTFLLAPNRGSPLRSLTRSRALDTLRLPLVADGLWANEPYLMRLIGAAPALHVAQVLYLRWDQRSGGLTESWTRLPSAALLRGFNANATAALALIDSSTADTQQRAALRHALLLHLLPRLHAIGADARDTPLAPLLAANPNLQPPPALALFDAQIGQWAQARRMQLLDERAQAPA